LQDLLAAIRARKAAAAEKLVRAEATKASLEVMRLLANGGKVA
jgi:hypothetical protein